MNLFEASHVFFFLLSNGFRSDLSKSSRIILEYRARNGDLETKTIDLLDLAPNTEVDGLVKKLVREEPLIAESTKDTWRLER